MGMGMCVCVFCCCSALVFFSAPSAVGVINRLHAITSSPMFVDPHRPGSESARSLAQRDSDQNSLGS
jgi:hypothetical protein